jgi:transposase-like protein
MAVIIQNEAIHVAMGVNMEGHKEILGLWREFFIEPTAG